MTIHFVTRHSGAREWAREHGVRVDNWMSHLDISSIKTGDLVIGTLPVNIIADLQTHGVRYFNLSLNLPFEWRGCELSSEQMEQAQARLEEYRVIHIQQKNT